MKRPLAGRWHHGNGTLCNGTLRIARADFDTSPSDEFKNEVFAWMAERLNEPPAEKEALDALKGLLGVIDECKGHGIPIIRNRVDALLAMEAARAVLARGKERK